MIVRNVSVAMATYNGAGFLMEQLKSLAAQTHLPFELVITDDGSTDATEAIIREFSDQVSFPVHFHRNPTRLQFAENFFRAASLCAGELIAFCDQDDVWLPRKLEIAVSAFRDPGISAFIHSAWVVDADLTLLGHAFPSYPAEGVGRWQPMRTYYGFTMVFRKELLEIPYQIRPPGPGNPIMAHDQWLAFVAEAFGDLYFSRKCLALYRQHGANLYGAGKNAKFRSSVKSSVSTGHDNYAFVEELISARRSFLDILSADPRLNAEHRARLVDFSIRHQKYIEKTRRRKNLYQRSGIGRRLLALIEMLGRGDYFGQQGLGSKSLIKDVVMSFAGGLVH